MSKFLHLAGWAFVVLNAVTAFLMHLYPEVGGDSAYYMGWAILLTILLQDTEVAK